MTLRVRTHGFILCTERFEQCVGFYRDILELPVWFEKQDLVCFRFGGGYLMVETGGVARDGRKPESENPAILRFNVDSVEKASETLRSRGLNVHIQKFDWGTVGAFHDPDGNACEFKNADDPYFTS